MPTSMVNEEATITPSDQHHDLVQLIHNNVPDLIGIYLFGSQATGTEHARSDIDIAILPKHELPAMKRWQLAQRLAAKLSREIDLVDPHSNPETPSSYWRGEPATPAQVETQSYKGTSKNHHSGGSRNP